jgi:hypothetical protein
MYNSLNYFNCIQQNWSIIAHMNCSITNVIKKVNQAGWVCLNIDETCINGSIGCGGVIRGNEGEWLHGFSKFIGKGDAYIVESWGVLEGIKLARRLNFTKVEVRRDSLGVVKDITNKKASQMNGRALIGRIGQLMDHDWDVVVKHAY